MQAQLDPITWERRERERVAYHEAGHACAAWRMGCTMERIIIHPSIPAGCYAGNGGCVWMRGPAGLPHAEFVRRKLLIYYAGPEAQRRHDPTSDVSSGATDDYFQADNLAGIIHRTPDELVRALQQGEQDAEKFVLAEWRSIEALAQNLLIPVNMSGDVAIRIMKFADNGDRERSLRTESEL